jgi:hypothetical protein
MADNVTANAGSGGATFKTDDDGTAHWPYTKLAYGADNTQTIVSTTNPLPVMGTGTAGTANANVLTVQGIASMTAIQVADNGGSLTVDNGGTFAVQAVCTNAGTFAVQAVCTNAGTFAVQVDGNALTALQLIDNIVHVDDAAYTLGTHSGVMIMGFAGTQSVDANDAAALACTTAGALHIHDGGNTITVDGTVAISGTVTVDGSGATQPISHAALTELASALNAEDVASASADAGMVILARRTDTPANQSGTDGDYEFLQVAAGRLWTSATVDAALPAGTNNIGDVDVLSIAAGDNNIGNVDIASIAAGDNNIGNVDVVTLPNVTLAAGTNTNEVVGDAAHDAAVAGNPLRIGARADTALSGITLVADGDTTDLYAGVDGVLIVRPHTGLEDVVAERTTNTDGASTAFASGLASPGAGVRLCITNVTICNSSASFCTVDLRDGAAGSVLWTLPVPATGGVTMKFDPPLKLSAATALAFDPSAATSTITISASGFKTKL